MAEKVWAQPVPELLTDDEHQFVALMGEGWNLLNRINEHGPTRVYDLAEAVAHVHALQHMVLAQAAARGYPDLYRRLGQSRTEDAAPTPLQALAAQWESQACAEADCGDHDCITLRECAAALRATEGAAP